MNGIGRKPTPSTCDGINNYGNKTGKDIEYHPAGTTLFVKVAYPASYPSLETDTE